MVNTAHTIDITDTTYTISNMSFDTKNIIDFHAHILPRADHGSSSVETSLCQLNFAKGAGVNKIIATPHFYPNSHILESFFKRRDNAYRSLLELGNEEMPKIKLGAEVLLCENLNKFAELDKLCIEGTRTMLLELPFVSFENSYISTVEKIMDMDIDIILAHADKYPKGDIEQLLMLGVRLQLNADSLATFRKRKHLYNWMERGAVVAIGSDIHNKDPKSYKKFGQALEKIPEETLKAIVKYSNSIWPEEI